MKNTDLEKIKNLEGCEFLTLPITAEDITKTDDLLKRIIHQFRKDNTKDELINKSRELKENSEKATEIIKNGTEVTIHDNQHKDGLEGKVIDYCKGYNKYLVQLDDFNAAYIDRDNLKVKKLKLVLTKEFLIKDKISGKDAIIVAKITGDDKIVNFYIDNGKLGSIYVNNKDDIFSSQTEKYATYFYYEYMYERYLTMINRVKRVL